MNNKAELSANKIYDWMNMNKNNNFIQNLGRIWLKSLIRKSLSSQ